MSDNSKGILHKPPSLEGENIEELPVCSDLNSVPDEFDNFGHKIRGIALIFLHEKFHPRMECLERVGVAQGLASLEAVLNELRFEVVVRTDSTYAEVHDALDEVAKRDHSDFECLMVIVATHGRETHLTAYDGWYEIRDLWDAFTPDKCPSLVGKPKMFFIQSCRGGKADQGVNIYHYGYETDSATTQSECQGPTPVLNRFVIPSTADLLIMYSTFEGSVSWKRHTGSWFIQSLCLELRSHWNDKELLDILRRICLRVAYSYQTIEPNQKQMPTIVTTLTKSYFFR